MDGNGIFSAEHWQAWHYFHLFSAAGGVHVISTCTQGSFYNESAIVSVPESEDGRHLCMYLTPLSLILVVSTSTRQLSRSKHKAYAIGLLPSRPWGWPTFYFQLAKHYKVCSVNVAFTLNEQLHVYMHPNEVWRKLKLPFFFTIPGQVALMRHSINPL